MLDLPDYDGAAVAAIYWIFLNAISWLLSNLGIFKMGNVFIAGTATAFPPRYPAEYVAEKFYPTNLSSERTNRLAKRVAASFGIKHRTVCLDLERVPERTLVDVAHHPLSWCTNLVEQLSTSVSLEKIGYLGVAYNTSFHTNTLPTLSCQTAIRCDLTLRSAPQDFVNYGCAGGLVALENAVAFCKANDEAAVVITFDQCLSRALFNYDPNCKMFHTDMVTNLLFTDGAAAILIIPESMKDTFTDPMPRVCDIQNNFSPSTLIRFDDLHFVLSDDIKRLVPPLVAGIVVKPMLSNNHLCTSDVREWSFHQGGSEVLRRFHEAEVLGLSNDQIARSRKSFNQFGNMSAPSCFLVLDSFCTEPRGDKLGQFGMCVSFGAGFYMGALLYRYV